MTTIAIVDDHIIWRSGLSALINGFGDYQVLFEADNGDDLIGQIGSGKVPEIVLLDITMPGKNGYETADWIHHNYPAIKIIVLSMMDHDSAIIRMLKNGAKGYLLKDTKPAILLQALNSIRDTGYYLNEHIARGMAQHITDGKFLGDNNVVIKLTDREIEFLRLACSEKSYKEIAAEMNIAPRTIDSYRDGLFQKLNITSRVGLVLFAIKNGIFYI